MKDYFGKNAERLKNKKLWLFDLDGTVYVDDSLLPGATELLKRIIMEDMCISQIIPLNRWMIICLRRSA